MTYLLIGAAIFDKIESGEEQNQAVALKGKFRVFCGFPQPESGPQTIVLMVTIYFDEYFRLALVKYTS